MAGAFVGDGDSNNLLKIIQERSDDFSEAVLVPPGWRVADEGVPVSPLLEKTILLLVKAGGGYFAVPADEDVELILNDGILDRMGIPLRHARISGEPLVPASLIPPP
jgi:hypothetical protein